MSAVVAGAGRRMVTPSGAAEEAAEAVRALNHLTVAAPSPGVPGWEDVGDVYRVLGEVRLLVDRLPQVCDQLTTGLHRLGDREDWLTDDGTDDHPDNVVAAAVERLHVAGCVAEDLSRRLQQAHCAVAHLYQ